MRPQYNLHPRRKDSRRRTTRVFEDSYRTVTYRDGEGAEDEKYFLGKRRERDGFTALVRAADAPLIGRKCEKPDLESIMVHLEKGV